MESSLLALLTKAFAFVLTILGRIFARRPVPETAEKILEETSPTLEAVDAAEANAEEKFGPRPKP